MIVLGVEEEVGADDGHAHGDDIQDDEHQKHEPVDVVNLRSRLSSVHTRCTHRRGRSEVVIGLNLA